MAAAAIRVQEKGQVTIPLEIRQKLGLRKGDLVTFVETTEGFVIKPATVVVNETLDEIGEALRAKGVTLEQWIERGREIRGEIAREKYGLVDVDKAS